MALEVYNLCMGTIGGWGSMSAVEKQFFPTPAPKKGEERKDRVFDKGAEVRKDNIKALVARLKQNPPRNH